MRQAAMPRDDEQLIAREKIPDDIGIRKNRAEHQRPSDDSPAIHRARGEHIFAAENGLPNQCAGDPMYDRIHRSFLADGEQRASFGHNFADATGGDAVSLESVDGGIRRFSRDRDQQAAGSLRIEEQISVFLRDARSETHAIADKIAVIHQTAREEAGACGFKGPGKIRNCRMIDLEGYRLDSS